TSYIIMNLPHPGDHVVGNFAGLIEGATLTVNGYNFTISYVGGDGNDVVLNYAAATGLTVSNNETATNSAPGFAIPGSTITYTVVVNNPGSNSASAAISDLLPAGIISDTYTATQSGGATGFTASGTGNVNDNAAILPAGSAITYSITGMINPSISGNLVDTATITYSNNGTLTPSSSSNTVTLVPQSDLSVTDTDNAPNSTPGAILTYTVVVTNTGPSDATGASIIDSQPANISSETFTATQTGGATGITSGSGGISNTVDMPAGSTITYLITGTVSGSASGSIVNTATATVGTDPNAANNIASSTTSVQPSADLQISTNSDGVSSLTPGQTDVYTVVVTNAGPNAVAGAVVTDLAPNGLNNVHWTSSTTSGVTATNGSGSNNLIDTLSMPSGSTITYVITGTVNASASGTIVNTASIAAPSGVNDPNTGNNVSTDLDTLGNSPFADLQVTLS